MKAKSVLAVLSVLAMVVIITPQSVAATQYTVTTTSKNAGAHPDVSVKLMADFLERTLSGFSLKMPDGFTINPQSTIPCNRGLFSQGPAQAESILAERATGQEQDPEAFITTGVVPSLCIDTQRVGTVRVRNAGWNIKRRLIDVAIDENCDGLSDFERFWHNITEGRSCSTSVVNSVNAELSEVLDIDVLNNLTGSIYNCQVFGEGEEVAYAQFCITVEMLPEEAILIELEEGEDAPDPYIQAQDQRAQLEEELDGLKVPSLYLRFTCKASFRDTLDHSGDYGSNLNCDLPEEYMWLLTDMTLRFNGATGADRQKHLLTNPTKCGQKSIDGLIYQRANGRDQVQNIGPNQEPWNIINCPRLPFRPRASATAQVNNQVGNKPQITVTESQQYGHSQAKSSEVYLPDTLHHRQPQAQPCDRDAARGCQGQSKIGQAQASTPLSRGPLRGDIFLMEDGNGGDRSFPIRLKLSGLADITVNGSVSHKRRRVAIALADLPQLPFTEIQLSFEGGEKAIAWESQICRSPVNSTFVDFNGINHNSESLLAVSTPCYGFDPDDPDDPGAGPEQPDDVSWSDPADCKGECPLNIVVEEAANYPSITSYQGRPYVSFIQDIEDGRAAFGSRRPVVVRKLKDRNWSTVGDIKHLNLAIDTLGGIEHTLSERSVLKSIDGKLRLAVSKRFEDNGLAGLAENYTLNQRRQDLWQRTYSVGAGSDNNRLERGAIYGVDLEAFQGRTFNAISLVRDNGLRAYLDDCRDRDMSCQLYWMAADTPNATEQDSRHLSLAIANNRLHWAWDNLDFQWQVWANYSGSGKAAQLINNSSHHEAGDPSLARVGNDAYLVWRERIDIDQDGPNDSDGDGTGDRWRVYASRFENGSWERVTQRRRGGRGERETIFDNSELGQDSLDPPAIADVNGVPYVAYTIRNDLGNQHLRVKRWDAGSSRWVQVGGDIDGRLPPHNPSITAVNGVPYVAYSAGRVGNGEGIEQVFVKALDTDGDSRVDGDDNCQEVANPGQEDLDGDKRGDACDRDFVIENMRFAIPR